jgi:hypothetical protein
MITEPGGSGEAKEETGTSKENNGLKKSHPKKEKNDRLLIKSVHD